MAKKGLSCWKDHFTLYWNLDDLRKVVPTLTDEQCAGIFQRLYDEYDPRVGMNNDVIEMITLSYLRREKEAVSIANQKQKKSYKYDDGHKF